MADKVLCPWCGAEMEEHITFASGRWWKEYKCPKCSAKSPPEETREQARAAALRRYAPPIKPMTLEEVDEHVRSNDANPLWIEDKTGHPSDEWILAGTVWQMCKIMRNRDEYGKTWRCWERKPTDEERSAAGWEK